jgi:acetyl/propionyl-CoA carboxylase alpha subunit
MAAPSAEPESEAGAHPMHRLAVANRGEIARRDFRASRSLGIETVAIFADDDRDAPFVAEADRAVSLGDGPPAATYLDVGRVVAAAVAAGADAVHPGYGFLSEDAGFADACLAAGLVWVGPPPAAMALMGHKARAKAAVAAAGVPVLASQVVPNGVDGDLAELARLGGDVGYPLLVKASAGGGGRGMRLVDGPAALADAVVAARREAATAFGSDDVFLERYVVGPRHVEVQVVADRHGNIIHLYDRDCSVQRRHQKVIEEAPASLVADAVRRTMWDAAVAATKAVAYEGVGTVEFVVSDDECAFLEMNTRLQVEHGVTELVTGVDLVQLQLAVAAGRPLPFRQDDVAVTGHAVEVRLCAEVPRHDYRPAPGRVVHARWPDGDGDAVRVDAAVESGGAISPAYDNLVAKLLAWGDDRATAVARLRAAVRSRLELDGVETNRDLLVAALGEVDFVAGRTSTDYLDAHPDVVDAAVDPVVQRHHAAAAALYLNHRRAARSLVPGAPPGWRNVGRALHRDRFVEMSGGGLSVSISWPLGRLAVVVEGPDDRAGRLGRDVSVDVAVTGPTTGTVALAVDGVVVRHRVRDHGQTIAVSSADGQSTLVVADDDDVADDAKSSQTSCRAPLPGSVGRVLVAVGDVVDRDQPLVVLEAMKMEHTLRAAGPGTVQDVPVAAGDHVDVGQLLVVVVTP